MLDWDKINASLGNNNTQTTSKKGKGIDWDKINASLSPESNKKSALQQEFESLLEQPTDGLVPSHATKPTLANPTLAQRGSKAFLETLTLGGKLPGANKIGFIQNALNTELAPATKPIEKAVEFAGRIHGDLPYILAGEALAGAAPVAKGLSLIKNPLARRAVTGATIGLGYGATKGVLSGEKPVDVAKEAGKSAAEFGVIDLGLGAVHGAGKTIKPLVGKLKLDVPKLTSETPKLNASNLPDTRSKIVSQANIKPDKRNIWDKFYTKFINNQAAIGQFSRAAQDKMPEILAANSRNVGGTIQYILNNGLVDQTGKNIGVSLKEIVQKIPQSKAVDFEDYLLHKHNIARMEEGKPVFGEEITPEISRAKIIQYETENPEFKELGNQVNKFLKSFMETWGKKSGLISDELWTQLKNKYPDYVPTNRVFSELEKGKNYVKRSFVNQTSGIKKATGSERDIISPIENIMGLVDRTVKAARYNEVGQAILNAIRRNPEKLKPWAEIVETKDELLKDINKTLADEGIEGVIQKFNEQFDAVFNPSKGMNKKNIVRVMENGKPVYIRINNKDFLEAITGLTKSQIGDIERIARSVTDPYKSLITGKNPFFAVRNIFRDIPTSYVYGSEANPVKFLTDLVESAVDMLKNKESFREYKALGGGNVNFFKQEAWNLLKGKTNPIEAFNNFTETLPRYAEYKRTVRRGSGTYESKMQGLYNAGEVTTNFARHGNITKSLDAFVPYLNPAVQGLDRFARQFLNKPLQTIIKGGIAITAPTLILDYINSKNPNYKQLDNRTKDTYFLIPKEDGTFIKVPKSRELGVLFGSLAERIMRWAQNDPRAFRGFYNTVATNFAPSNPIENNILSPLAYNIPKNKDFANRTIVPQSIQDRSPRYQYDEKTSEIAKKIGDIANLSPKQIDYLIKSYTGVIGQILLPATTKGANAVTPIKSQFIVDPLYSNDQLNLFYENLDKLKERAADRNFVQNIPSKYVTREERIRNDFNKASQKISDLRKQATKIQTSDMPRNEIERRVRELQRVMIKIAEQQNKKIEQGW